MSLIKTISRHLTALSPRPTSMRPRCHPNAPVNAILFDIYGTLLISASGDIGLSTKGKENSAALKQLFLDFGIQIPLPELQDRLNNAIILKHKQMITDGVEFPEIRIESIWQALLGWQDPEKIKALALEYELIVNPVWPMPHLWTVLNALRLKHIVLGIISNAQFYTPLIMETLAGASLEELGFGEEVTIFSYQHDCAKPSVSLFERAADKLRSQGFAPENVLYVGNDMRNDMLPARQVGFQTALFAGDKRSLRLRQEDPGSDPGQLEIILTDLKQLLEVPFKPY